MNNLSDNKTKKPILKVLIIVLIAVLGLLLLKLFTTTSCGCLGDVPNPLYSCYPAGTKVNGDGTLASDQTVQILQNVTAFEGNNKNNKTAASFIERPNTNTEDIQTNKIYCKNSIDGKEIDQPYTVVKRSSSVISTTSIIQDNQFACYSENTRIKGDGTLVENQQNINEIKDSIVLEIENGIHNQTRKAFTSQPSVEFLNQVQNKLSCIQTDHKNEITQNYVIVKNM